MQRAYVMSPTLIPDEVAILEANGAKATDYVAVICPSIQAPRPAPDPRGNPQIVNVNDPATGTVIGQGMIFLVPVVVPIGVPKIATGILEANGKARGSVQIEGPPHAVARVLVPRASLTPEARGELAAIGMAHLLGTRDMLRDVGVPDAT